tara:strand:+ start:11359 stop:12138 length:780 start_codon:yes stop_codon:yes gene_type:complete
MCINKVVVLDLDDTIGHFEEISMFLGGLQLILGKQIGEKYLYKLLDLWPKFLRLGIIDILRTIKKQKRKDKSIKVVIYTNNMGPRSWTLLIKRYLEKKIKYPIFDKVITAYRPNSKSNCRTTHSKTYNDLVKCTGYNNAEFVFLDDQMHPLMNHPKIKYIHVNPYNYGIPFKKMISSFLKSNMGLSIKPKDRALFEKYMYKYLNSGSGDHKYVVQRSKISKRDRTQLKEINRILRKFLNIRNTRHKRRRKRKNKTKRFS